MLVQTLTLTCRRNKRVALILFEGSANRQRIIRENKNESVDGPQEGYIGLLTI